MNLAKPSMSRELKGHVSPPGRHGSQYNSKDDIMIVTVEFSFGDFRFLFTWRFLIPLSRGKLRFSMEPMSTLNKGAGIIFVNGDMKWAGKWTWSLVIFSTQGTMLTLGRATNTRHLPWESVDHSTLGTASRARMLLKAAEPPCRPPPATVM